MNLEALKSLESELLRELETKTTLKKNNLQKHRQILLNSAHFLRLYYQSSFEAKELLINHNHNKTEKFGCEDETKNINIDGQDINMLSLSLISKNGLRFLWSALQSDDFVRASFLLKFLKSKQKDLPDISSNSLDYFREQLKDKIISKLVLKTDSANFLFYSLFLILEDNNDEEALVTCLKKHLEKNFTKGLENFKNLFCNMSIFQNDEIIDIQSETNIFIETKTGYCEFPQLKLLKYENYNSQNQIFIFKEEINSKLINIKTQLLEFVNETVAQCINNEIIFDSSLMPLIKEIGLNPDLIESITLKLDEIQLKNNSDSLKSRLSDFFDCLMKEIQSAIRSTTENFNLSYRFSKEESILKNKTQSLCQLIISSKITSQQLSSLIQSFQPTLTNKSNIILTIQRNELASLNSKREIPIGSKSYLAIQLCNQIKLYIQQEYSQSSTPAISCFLTELNDRIASIFFNHWITEIRTNFLHLSNTSLTNLSEPMALYWLSDLFIRLQVTPEDSQIALKDLNLINIIISEKYPYQAALFIGLQELKKISIINSPSLSGQITKPSKLLLPHFVPNL